MKFSELEISQLIKAWAVIALAFTIASTIGAGRSLGQDSEAIGTFLRIFFLSSLTVGLAFLLHELAHKFIAEKYGCWAEFRSFDLGLILAVIMSFAGFIFAAPGAVVISGVVSTSENGKIAAAGPITNLVLAGLFLFIGSFITSGGWLAELSFYGVEINAWLAVFNLIPFGPLDGVKVIRWNSFVWILLIGTGFLLL